MSLVVRYPRVPSDHDLQLAADADAEMAIGSDGVYWLRFRDGGPKSKHTDSPQAVVGCLSGEPFELIDDVSLCRPQNRVPHATLEEMTWRKVRETLRHKLGVIQLPESFADPSTNLRESPLTLTLIRGSEVPGLVPPVAKGLLTSVPTLSRWANSASLSRLSTLRWMLIDDQALVLGTPLPTIAGTFHTHIGRLILPAGLWWNPCLPAQTVEQILQKPCPLHHPLMLWQADGTVVFFPEDALSTLRRGSLRQLMP